MPYLDTFSSTFSSRVLSTQWFKCVSSCFSLSFWHISRAWHVFIVELRECTVFPPTRYDSLCPFWIISLFAEFVCLTLALVNSGPYLNDMLWIFTLVVLTEGRTPRDFYPSSWEPKKSLWISRDGNLGKFSFSEGWNGFILVFRFSDHHISHDVRANKGHLSLKASLCGKVLGIVPDCLKWTLRHGGCMYMVHTAHCRLDKLSEIVGQISVHHEVHSEVLLAATV